MKHNQFRVEQAHEAIENIEWIVISLVENA